MDLIDILIKDHSLLRASLESLELHFGPERGPGWEDQVSLDRAEFRRDLEAVTRALRAHEELEEKFVASAARTSLDEALGKMLLESHGCIDSLLKLFGAVASSIQDGRVHGTRMVLSRLREEITRHMEEEETELFPRLRKRRGAASGAWTI